MRLPIFILVFIIIPFQISGQGITRHGRVATESSDFVNKNGKAVHIPSLSRYGEELFMVTVTTSSVTSVISNSAKSGGNIVNPNNLDILACGLCWSTSPNPDISDFRTSEDPYLTEFTSHLTLLFPATTYYLRAYVTTIAGTAYGEEISFRTLPRTDPSECLIAWYPFNGNANEATGMGTDGIVNGAALTEDRFGNAESAYYFNGNDNSITIPGYLPVTNTFTISFWAYNEKINGSANIITDGSKNIGGMDFLLNFRGNEIGIRADKGTPLNYEYSSPAALKNLNLLNRWVHVAWVMDAGMSAIYLDGIKLADINTAGTNEGYHDDYITIGARHVWTAMDNFFQGALDEFRIYNCNLQPDEIYSIYSAEGPMLPSVATVSLSDTTSVSISVESNINNDGGATVTERGVCWSSSPNPTIADNRTTDGTGTGSFTSNVTGLLPGTTYYIRSYATSSAGTAYSEEIVLTTCNYIPPVVFNTNITYGSVTDIEGNVYKTVKIGNQEWMAENLKTTKYNNGESIPLITDDNTWHSLTDGAFSWLNDNICYKDTYGAIYNWYAASKDICPDGWHLPTNAEWSLLNSVLGGIGIAGGKLKEEGTSHWSIPNTGATNESGFSALPAGGFRNGALFGIGEFATFWTSTEYPDNQAFYRSLRYNSPSESYSVGYKSNGSNIRCLKGPVPPKPVVTTLWAKNIMSDKAEIVSGISSVLPVNSRGVCWNTSPAPEVLDNKTTNDGGTGSFTSLLTGLESNTTYYVRAYSINDDGITYGNEITFSTVEDLPTVGLAAYWPFNGNANDESGNDNHGTIYGATLVADRFGNPEKAYYFNGINNKIYIGDSLIVQGHITVACWIKSTDNSNQIISSGSRNSYRIGKTNDGVDAAVYLTDSSDGYGLDVHAVTDCSDWTHVAIVYNGVSLGLYVNGQLMDTAYGPGNVFCNQPVYLNFGTYQWVSTYYGYYQGYLDDVYMFNRALSNSEIEALYHEGGW